MKTRKAAQRRAKTRRRQAFLAIGLIGILGVGTFMLTPHSGHHARVAFSDHDEVDHNAEMIQQTFTLQQAVDAYRQAHGGSVPKDAAAFDQEIVQGGYLQTKQLPASPWGGRQPAMIQATEQVRAALEQGAAASNALGAAMVDREIRSPNTLGALCYEAVSPTEYRLYGIGRGRTGQATVIIQLGTPLTAHSS